MKNGSAIINRAPLKHPEKFFINGEWVFPSSDARIDVIVPASEQIYVQVAEAMDSDVEQCIAAARKAFDHGPWPRMTHSTRAEYLRKMADILDERVGDVAEIWPNEMGVVHTMAKAYSGAAGSIFRSYAALADTFSFEEVHPTSSGAKLALLAHEPVGVVGVIIPWNAPIMMIAHKVAPALLAGCTVIIKSAPEAPGHALLFAELVEVLGFPPGVINVVTAGRTVSERLVRHPDVDKISFTGSSAAGKHIAALLGARMARYTLELGGKSAAIILDDYDVAVAARAIGERASDMSGQVCAALTRIIVSKSRHDSFVESLSAIFTEIKVGDPFDPATQMGPLAGRRQRDRVEGYIAKGRELGFVLAAGGGRPRGLERGFYIEPTVFGNVDNNSILAQEEIFGPVVVVIPAESEAHLVQLANASVYGLNGSVFTNDPDRAYAVSRQIRSGTVGHNGFKIDFDVAFGGVKESGVGREGGVEGLRAYLETKTILLDAPPTHRVK